MTHMVMKIKYPTQPSTTSSTTKLKSWIFFPALKTTTFLCIIPSRVQNRLMRFWMLGNTWFWSRFQRMHSVHSTVGHTSSIGWHQWRSGNNLLDWVTILSIDFQKLPDRVTIIKSYYCYCCMIKQIISILCL